MMAPSVTQRRVPCFRGPGWIPTYHHSPPEAAKACFAPRLSSTRRAVVARGHERAFVPRLPSCFRGPMGSAETDTSVAGPRKHRTRR